MLKLKGILFSGSIEFTRKNNILVIYLWDFQMWKHCKLYIISIILTTLRFGLFITTAWDHLLQWNLENSTLGISIKYVCSEFFKVWFSVGSVRRSSLVSSPCRKFEGRHQFLNSSGQHPLKFDFFARFCCYGVFHFESRTVSNFFITFFTQL